MYLIQFQHWDDRRLVWEEYREADAPLPSREETVALGPNEELYSVVDVKSVRQPGDTLGLVEVVVDEF